jgi:hypothetical protein
MLARIVRESFGAWGRGLPVPQLERWIRSGGRNTESLPPFERSSTGALK